MRFTLYFLLGFMLFAWGQVLHTVVAVCSMVRLGTVVAIYHGFSLGMVAIYYGFRLGTMAVYYGFRLGMVAVKDGFSSGRCWVWCTPLLFGSTAYRSWHIFRWSSSRPALHAQRLKRRSQEEEDWDGACDVVEGAFLPAAIAWEKKLIMVVVVHTTSKALVLPPWNCDSDYHPNEKFEWQVKP